MTRHRDTTTSHRRRLSIALVLCLALCSACGTQKSVGSQSNGSASSVVAMGAPERTVNAQWDVNPAATPCVRENLELTCYYVYRGVRLTVGFNQQGHAELFIAGGRPSHLVDMWRFLNSLVPSGSHRLSCRSITHSSGGGTAHACLYGGASTMIVAYFPHPNDPSFDGEVTYDYASYRDIEPQDTR